MSPHRDIAGWCEDNPNTYRLAYHEQGSSKIEVGKTWAFVDHRCDELSSVMATAAHAVPKTTERAA